MRKIKYLLSIGIVALSLPSCAAPIIPSPSNSSSIASNDTQSTTQDLVTVTFDTGVGTHIPSQTYEKGSFIIKLDDPSIEYGKFDTWYFKDSTGKEIEWLFDIFTVNKDITLVASYQMANRSIRVAAPGGDLREYINERINRCSTGHSYFNNYSIGFGGGTVVYLSSPDRYEYLSNEPNIAVFYVYEQLNGEIMTHKPVQRCSNPECFGHYYIKENLDITNDDIMSTYEAYEYLEGINSSANKWLASHDDFLRISNYFAYKGTNYLLPISKLENARIGYGTSKNCDTYEWEDIQYVYGNIYICLAIVKPYLDFYHKDELDDYDIERTAASHNAIIKIAEEFNN